MNNKFSLSEKETVGLYFPRCFDYFLHFFRREVGHVVHKLPFVHTIGDDKSKAKTVVSDDPASEVVSLYHFKVLDRLSPYPKPHSQANSLQVQEVRSQVVLN